MRLSFPSRFIAKFILLIGVLIFVFVGFLGFSYTDMAMGQDGQMSPPGCFMPGMTTSLCQMGPLEHVAAWQDMFTAVPSQLDSLTLILLLSAVLVFGLLLRRRAIYLLIPSDFQSRPVYQRADTAPFNPFQELFSDGILHPKIF